MGNQKSKILESKQQRKSVELDKSRITWLRKTSLSELHNALSYVEGLANAARNKMTEVLQMSKHYGIDADEMFSVEMKRIFEVFTEHDAWSFEIEGELDRRMKPRMKNKYGAKDLLRISIALDTKMKNIVKDIEKKKKDSEAEGSGDSPLVVS